MDNAFIKENIKKVRMARKFTQEEIADKLGISVTAYRDFENGETAIVNKRVIRLADLLETSAEELVLGYKPCRDETQVVEDMERAYGNQINTLEQRITDQNKVISSLEETVASKNEIIKMLKKRLGEEE